MLKDPITMIDTLLHLHINIYTKDPKKLYCMEMDLFILHLETSDRACARTFTVNHKHLIQMQKVPHATSSL